jgi:hypothetical protein
MVTLRASALLLCAAFAFAEWSVCPGVNSIRKGSCNSATSPCEPGSGCTNAGVVDSIEACESKCEAAPNCSAIEWHATVKGAWNHVCVLQTQAAWHTANQAGHEAACIKGDSFPACKCGGGPSPGPGPSPPGPAPPMDALQCLVHQVAYEQSDKLLGGRGNGAVYAALGLQSCPNVTEIPTTPLEISAAVALAASAFYVDPAKGSDSNTGTSAAKAFKTLQKAQLAVRALGAGRAGAVVNLMDGTHELGTSLVFTADDSGTAASPVTWQAAQGANDVVVSGGTSINCDWQPVMVNSTAPGPTSRGATSESVAAFKCSTKGQVNGPFSTLFINGFKQVCVTMRLNSTLHCEAGHALTSSLTTPTPPCPHLVAHNPHPSMPSPRRSQPKPLHAPTSSLTTPTPPCPHLVAHFTWLLTSPHSCCAPSW